MHALSTAYAASVHLRSDLQDECFHVGEHGRLMLYPTGCVEYVPTTDAPERIDTSHLRPSDNKEQTVGFRVNVVPDETRQECFSLSITGPPVGGGEKMVSRPSMTTCGVYGSFVADDAGYEYRMAISSMPSDGMERFSWDGRRVHIGFVSTHEHSLALDLPVTTCVDEVNGAGGDFRRRKGDWFTYRCDNKCCGGHTAHSYRHGAHTTRERDRRRLRQGVLDRGYLRLIAQASVDVTAHEMIVEVCGSALATSRSPCSLHYTTRAANNPLHVRLRHCATC